MTYIIRYTCAICVLCWGISTISQAQVRNYTFNSAVNTYNEITGGTQHGSGTVDDKSYDTLDIGFTFDYCGQSFSKVSINSNGYIAFGNPISESYNPVSDPYTNDFVVSALAYDIKGQSTAEIRSQTSGTSPGRIFTVQWKDFKRYSATYDSLDFQIRLYENSNKVEIVYGRCILDKYTNGVDNLFEVGIRGSSVSDFNTRSVSDNNNWSSSTTGKVNSATCRITNSIKPDVGLTYSWEKLVYQNDVSIDQVKTFTGCGASSAENITVLVKNNGSMSASLIPLSYQINSQSVVTETMAKTLTSGDSTYYTFGQKADFSKYGSYSLNAWAGMVVDSFRDNDSLLNIKVNSVPSIKQFPYKEDFEQSDGYWHGEIITGANPWEWGVPSQTKINAASSGKNAWMTGLSSNYSNNSHSYLQSPCFDFTGFDHPSLSFYMYMETESKWDPMIVEASTDNGKTWIRVDSSNTSFYNTTKSGGPFDPPYFSGNTSRWNKYTASLDTFGNYPSVNIRFRFLGDGSTNDEGIAIDDIEIYASQDLSLEDFWAPADTICGDSLQMISLVVKNNGIYDVSKQSIVVNAYGADTHSLSYNFSFLAAGKTDTFHTGTFDLRKGGTYRFVNYIQWSGDHRSSNDTLIKYVYIKPGVPAGGGIIHDPNFSGIKKDGSSTKPDIVCLNEKGNYQFVYPHGLTLGNLNSDWFITDSRFCTESGYVPSDTFLILSNSRIYYGFTPRNADADSLFMMTITITLANGCQTTYTRYVKSGEFMNAYFTATDVCFGETTDFKNGSSVTSGSLNYFWDLDDGKTTTFENFGIKYSTADTFFPKLTITGTSGCTDSYSKTVYVYEIPAPDFMVNNACRYENVEFMNQTPAIADSVYYLWNYGNGHSDQRVNGTTSYDTGSYEVKLQAISIHSCTDSISKNITIFPRAYISFSSSDFCLGDSLLIVNNSKISNGVSLSYLWTYGIMDTSSSKNLLLKPTLPGKYDVMLKVTSSQNCTDSLIKSMTVHPNPSAAINLISEHACLGDSVQFMNNSTISDQDTLYYKWMLNNQDSSSLFEPYFVITGPGMIAVKLEVKSGFGCEDATIDSIMVHEVPVANFNMSTIEVCENDTVYLTNNSFISGTDALYYSWELGTQDTSSLKEPIFVPTDSGLINIILTTSTSWGCLDTSVRSLDVHPIPDAAFSYVLGTEGSVYFEPNDTTLQLYEWIFGDGNESSDKIPDHQYKSDASYMVYLSVVSQFLCKNSDSLQINVTGAGIPGAGQFGHVQIYPNPFEDNIQLNIYLENQTEAHVMIYNIEGKSLVYKELLKLQKGPNNILLNLEHLPKGSYVLRIKEADKAALFYKLLKVK